jgi:hypothetical protein
MRRGFIVFAAKEACMSLKRYVVALSGAAALSLFATFPAAAWLDRMVTRDTGYVPACDSAWALQTISWRFGYKEWRFWNSPERLTQFGPVREIAYRPWGPDYVPRRYCEVKVRVSEQRDTVVYYSIIEKGGFAGYGWGVEWCVVGHDYNLAYAPNCRAARP